MKTKTLAVFVLCILPHGIFAQGQNPAQHLNDETFITIDSVQLTGYTNDTNEPLKDRQMWEIIGHSPSKIFVLTCRSNWDRKQGLIGNCIPPKVGEAWRFTISDDGQRLNLHDDECCQSVGGMWYPWEIKEVKQRRRGSHAG